MLTLQYTCYFKHVQLSTTFSLVRPSYQAAYHRPCPVAYHRPCPVVAPVQVAATRHGRGYAAWYDGRWYAAWYDGRRWWPTCAATRHAWQRWWPRVTKPAADAKRSYPSVSQWCFGCGWCACLQGMEDWLLGARCCVAANVKT